MRAKEVGFKITIETDQMHIWRSRCRAAAHGEGFFNIISNACYAA